MVIFHHKLREQLLREFSQENITQPYCFVGPFGAGKFTLARWFAQRMVCNVNPGEPPCGTCPECCAVVSGTHCDIRIENADRASTVISIEEIRAVREYLSRTPLRARWTVVLLPDCDRLSSAAQHACLKLLEEPRGASIVLLTAASDDSLLPTLRSRVRMKRVGIVPNTMIDSALREADESLSGEEIHALVQYARGIPGRVLYDGVLREDVHEYRKLQQQFMAEVNKPLWHVQHTVRKAVEKEFAYAQLTEYAGDLMRLRVRENNFGDISFLNELSRSLTNTVNKDLAIDTLCLLTSRPV